MGNHSTLRPPPGYLWRKSRGLLTIRDHAWRYAAVRWPRGPYPVPLPSDLIEVRRHG